MNNAVFEVMGLRASNSLNFLERAFACYEAGKPFAILRGDIDPAAYPGLSFSEIVDESPRRGCAQMSCAHATDPEAIAHVVFSSGTEGRPKAIAISHKALADVEERLIAEMELTSEIREYIGVPVTYSFGLGRARVVSRVGGAFYLPEAFDPLEIRDMLAAGEINAISAVPSLWRLFLAQPGVLGDLGHKVRWIEIGSQYMSGAEKAALRGIFPQARIVQHYGLTEASRSTFLTIDGAEEAALESVGAATGRVEVKIGAAGEICLKGDHVAAGTVGDDGQIVPLVAEDGWLHTKDRGEIRDGGLYYLGRLDDQINLSGLKLAAERLEREVAELVTVAPGQFAITSVEDALRGEVVLLAYETGTGEVGPLLEAALVQALKARGIAAQGQVRIMAVDRLPRTGSGKIQRKDLRPLWLEQADSDAAAPERDDVELTPDERRIAGVWRSVLGAASLTPQTSFYDVGGDSLAAMQIGLAMEAHFPSAAVSATMEGRSLSEVAGLLSGQGSSRATLPDRTIETWAINITRGLMVISVLMSHWMPGIWERLMPGLASDPLAIISRMGTPGFAVVFGVGVGYFMLNGYPANRTSVQRRLRVSFVLVTAGLCLLVAVHLIKRMLLGGAISPLWLSETFYNVLAFYFLAVLTLPLWLRLFHGRVGTVVALGVPVLWALWLMAGGMITMERQDSFLEWPRLMLQAKYSYLHMMPYVLIGVFIGWRMLWFETLSEAVRVLLWSGVFLTGASLVGLSETYGIGILIDREATGWTKLWSAALYPGIACLILGGSIRLLRDWQGLNGGLRLGAKGLILLGGLALPIYAFQGIVIPVKDILVLLGAPGALALLLSLSVFFVLIGYGMWRLNRMYFSRG